MSEDGMVDCGKILADMALFLDREIDGVTSEQIAAHLDDCPPCKDRVDLEACVRDLLRTRCSEHAPDELIARIRLQLAEWSA